jgi:hypothetical protein
VSASWLACTLGGKRKGSNSTAQLEWVDSLTVQESPGAAKPRRRLTESPQEASPTICPKLLGSPLDQTLGQDLQTPFAGAVFDSTLTPEYTDFELERGWSRGHLYCIAQACLLCLPYLGVIRQDETLASDDDSTITNIGRS